MGNTDRQKKFEESKIKLEFGGDQLYSTGIEWLEAKIDLVENNELKEGDEVLFRQWAGTSCEFKGGSYIHLKQSDVLAVVRKKS